MKASELFVKCLEAEGVDKIFGVPGEENIALLDTLYSSKIDFITTRHEQGAAFMANVYGGLTGRAGVCLSTLGPGATNLLTGIADANLDRSPVVAITAQVSLERIHKESHQYVDILQSFKPMTKWNVRVEEPSIIPEVVRKAFKIAQMEKPGATHIEVPENIFGEEVNGAPLLKGSELISSAPHGNSLKEAVRLIEESERPVILAGNGVVRGRASKELRDFAEKTNIHVAHTFMGKGALSWDHPLSLLSIGLQTKDYVSCGFDRADLVISVGYDFVEYSPAFWNHTGDKRIIHIDFTPAEIDCSYNVSIELVGNIGETLRLLTPMVKEGKKDDYPKTLREFILRELEAYSQDSAFPMKPQRIMRELREVMGREDILISDVGAHKLWIARMYPAYKTNTVIISNGFASMGIALPGAIVAKMIYPEKKILAVCGDGGFLMTCQELETAARLKLPIVILIFNDGGYGLIKWKQLQRFKRSYGVGFGNPDFPLFARSFGCKGYRVENAQELKPLLKEAFEEDVPVIIDLPVDYSENLKLSERMGNFICPM